MSTKFPAGQQLTFFVNVHQNSGRSGTHIFHFFSKCPPEFRQVRSSYFDIFPSAHQNSGRQGPQFFVFSSTSTKTVAGQGLIFSNKCPQIRWQVRNSDFLYMSATCWRINCMSCSSHGKLGAEWDISNLNVDMAVSSGLLTGTCEPARASLIADSMLGFIYIILESNRTYVEIVLKGDVRAMPNTIWSSRPSHFQRPILSFHFGFTVGTRGIVVWSMVRI